MQSGKGTDGNFSILPVAIRIFQGTKKLVIKMLWVSCIDIISRSGDGASFQTVDAWTLPPDWKSANLHSFPTGKYDIYIHESLSVTILSPVKLILFYCVCSSPS